MLFVWEQAQSANDWGISLSFWQADSPPTSSNCTAGPIHRHHQTQGVWRPHCDARGVQHQRPPSHNKGGNACPVNRHTQHKEASLVSTSHIQTSSTTISIACLRRLGLTCQQHIHLPQLLPLPLHKLRAAAVAVNPPRDQSPWGKRWARQSSSRRRGLSSMVCV